MYRRVGEVAALPSLRGFALHNTINVFIPANSVQSDDVMRYSLNTHFTHFPCPSVLHTISAKSMQQLHNGLTLHELWSLLYLYFLVRCCCCHYLLSFPFSIVYLTCSTCYVYSFASVFILIYLLSDFK